MLNYSHKAQAPERGGKKLSRSEAARHASLVRWKKESPFAANVMERLAQIRAARLKKGKGKAKGGKGKAKAAKPKKDARTPQEKANQNRAAIAKETGMADLEGTMTRLSVGMSSDQEAAAYEELTKRGLAKTLPNGKTALTPAGKKWKRAADKGDAAGAKEALAEGEGKVREGADKEAARQQKKTEREKARTARAAAREKRKKGGGGKKPPPAKEKDAAPAQREKERQEDRAMRLADRAQRQKERAEDRATRAKDRAQREKERLADRAQRAKDRAARDAERKKKQAAGTTKEKAQRQRDIEQEVARIAAARARKGIAMDELTPIIADMQATIAELTEVAEEEGSAIKAGRRNNSGDQAAIDQGYELAMQLCDLFESLGADTGEEEEAEEHEMMGDMEGKSYTHDGDAVKALDGDRVGAYAVRFGSEQEPDMSPMRDYFTKATDYWLDAWDRRPMLFHHAMDEDTDDAPRIGTWTKAEVKDEGVWLEGQLDKAHRYYGAIKELVRRGVLRLSSDSAPHLVRRATKAGGIHEVTRWPLLAASLTPTPAEPRLTAVSFKALIAELGIDDKTNNPEAIHESDDRSDETKAADERTRRLLLLRTRILQLQE